MLKQYTYCTYNQLNRTFTGHMYNTNNALNEVTQYKAISKRLLFHVYTNFYDKLANVCLFNKGLQVIDFTSIDTYDDDTPCVSIWYYTQNCSGVYVLPRW